MPKAVSTPPEFLEVYRQLWASVLRVYTQQTGFTKRAGARLPRPYGLYHLYNIAFTNPLVGAGLKTCPCLDLSSRGEWPFAPTGGGQMPAPDSLTGGVSEIRTADLVNPVTA